MHRFRCAIEEVGRQGHPNIWSHSVGALLYYCPFLRLKTAEVMFLLGPIELKCAVKTNKITNIYKKCLSVIKTFFENKVEILFLFYFYCHKGSPDLTD